MTTLLILFGVFGYATQALGIGIQIKSWKQVKTEPTTKNALKALGYLFWGLVMIASGEQFVKWAGVNIPDVFWLTVYICSKWLITLIGLICTIICFVQAAKARQQRA